MVSLLAVFGFKEAIISRSMPIPASTRENMGIFILN
jgi:hypothetical protein